MAEAIVARQHGDEYQQLVFWKYALMMLNEESEIKNIRYEDDTVKSYDDVVIEYSKPQIFRDTTISKGYIQIKFHMRDDNLFTLDKLLDPAFINASTNSLLDNVVAAYRKLGTEFEHSLFVIYSMWDIAQDDILYGLVSNVDRTIDIDKLFEGKTIRSKMGGVRNKICTTLNINENELKRIFKQIRILSRQETLDDLKRSLNQKLENKGLQIILGSSYINPYAQLIQKLFASGHKVFNKAFLEEQLQSEGLYSCKKDESLVAIRSFIKHTEDLDIKAHHLLKLEDYFSGRFLKEEYQWCDTIYPLLKTFIAENCLENKDYKIQLEANSTIAFAAGRILDIKTGKRIIPIQRTENGIERWEKKENQSDYPEAICTDTIIDSKYNDVAVIIGLSRDIYSDVEEYFLEEKTEIGRILNIKFDDTNSATVVDGTHAWYLSNQIKNVIDNRSLREKRGVLHLFFSCPNAMVFILGRYSLSFGKIQLYEYDFGKQRTCTYYPTMALPVKGEL